MRIQRVRLPYHLMAGGPTFRGIRALTHASIFCARRTLPRSPFSSSIRPVPTKNVARGGADAAMGYPLPGCLTS